MLASLLLPLLFTRVDAGVAKSWTGVRATAYYDLEHLAICTHPSSGPWPNNWWNTINGGYTSCQGSGTTTYTLNSLGSNRIVAMDLNTDGRGPEYWCGKEVQIFKDGKQIILDEGPFVVYDNCGACGGGAIIDVSAKAFVQISGGKCGDNPEGLTVKVMENSVVASGRPGGGAAATTSTAATTAKTTAATTASTTSKASTTTKSSTTTTRASTTTTKSSTTTTKASTTTTKASTTSKTTTAKTTATTTAKTTAATSKTTPAVTTKSATSKSTSSTSSPTKTAPMTATTTKSTATTTSKTATTTPAPTKTSSAPARITTSLSLPADNGSAATCTFGKYVCDGRTLRICNYVTWNALGWVDITTCPTSCRFFGENLECI